VATLDDPVMDAARATLVHRRGDLAAHVAAGDWITPHRARVHGAWADGVEALAALCAAAERHDEVRALCERLVAYEPLRESAHRRLMWALGALGRRADALAHYAALLRRLQREVGAHPSPRTQALGARLAAAE
jgi:DNA-binding SARP family transcriptional activator